MNRIRLVLYREVFLAEILATSNFSTIQGLHHRFPMAWSHREQFPFYKHKYFERSLLKQEYRLKLSYCLFEEAHEDSVLFNALFEELYKTYASMYKDLKKKVRNSKCLNESLLKELIDRYVKAHSDKGWIKTLAVLDFFVEKLSVKYQKESTFLEYEQKLKHEISKYLASNAERQTANYYELCLELSQQNSSLVKNMKKFYRAYSEYLGENILEVLNQEIASLYKKTSPEDLGIAWLKELGVLEEASLYYLTLSDVYQLFALVLYTPYPDLEEASEIELVQLGNYEISALELSMFDKRLKEAIPYFMVYQTFKYNRDFFLQSYSINHQTMIDALQSDVKRYRRELQNMKKVNASLEENLNHQKKRHETELQSKIKELNKSIILLNREKEQLLKQLSQLQDHCQRLQPSEEIIALETEELVTSSQEQDETFSLDQINTAEILIVGGATPTIQKLKRILPDCKYFEVDKRYNNQFFNGVKVAILLTNILNHGMTNRLDKLCPDIIKRPVAATNIELIIKEIVHIFANDKIKSSH